MKRVNETSPGCCPRAAAPDLFQNASDMFVNESVCDLMRDAFTSQWVTSVFIG